MKSDSNEENKSGFLKQNFVYIAMVVILVGAIIYSGQHSETQEEEQTKPKFPLKFIVVVLVVLSVFIFLMVTSSKTFEKEAKRAVPKQKFYTQRLTKDEFEQETKDVTQRELQKLYENNKFNQMLKEKGNKQAEWVWQTKEKEKKVVFRENAHDEEDDDDNLSQITLSDD